MRHLVREAGLDPHIAVDSAGTAGYHTGEAPDRRARAAGARRGIAIEGAARQFKRADFARFDYVLAMDRENYDDLADLAPDASARQKLHLLRSFDPKTPNGADVPDPYYGGDDGFDDVLGMIERAVPGLLDWVRSRR